jgi:hypothetical protein
MQSAALELNLFCSNLVLGYMRTTEGGGQPMQLLFIKGLYVEWRRSTFAAPMLRFNASDCFHLGIGRLELICDWFHRSNEFHSGIDR